jgi:hypothetical protein
MFQLLTLAAPAAGASRAEKSKKLHPAGVFCFRAIHDPVSAAD